MQPIIKLTSLNDFQAFDELHKNYYGFLAIAGRLTFDQFKDLKNQARPLYCAPTGNPANPSILSHQVLQQNYPIFTLPWDLHQVGVTLPKVHPLALQMYKISQDLIYYKQSYCRIHKFNDTYSAKLVHLKTSEIRIVTDMRRADWRLPMKDIIKEYYGSTNK